MCVCECARAHAAREITVVLLCNCFPLERRENGACVCSGGMLHAGVCVSVQH